MHEQLSRAELDAARSKGAETLEQAAGAAGGHSVLVLIPTGRGRGEEWREEYERSGASGEEWEETEEGPVVVQGPCLVTSIESSAHGRR